MQQQTKYIVYDGRNVGPLGRALMAIAAAVLAVLSMVLGFFFFLAFLAVGLVVAGILWFRLRGVRRELRAAAAQAARQDDSVIEGDYTVVRSRREPGDPRP